ncbi:hypothetical protein L873DRAFT_1805285 [Choiromyces venosus 120613-1]|uniref:Uncharacterized protein n=1 Tax=Choiromyces venosus 120613-1 TaxID=1336337 RepID=A0A3N4JQH6_9PEZI|nr:hypothetical protein L873DRAFT_1805285 [Choiromyces venosus 120613-1]
MIHPSSLFHQSSTPSANPPQKPPHYTLQSQVPNNLIQDPKQQTITKPQNAHKQPPPGMSATSRLRI